IRIGKDGGMTLVDRQQGGREQSVGRAELLAAVKAIQAKHTDQAVVISADMDLRSEVVISVLDALQKGQVKRVGLLAKPAT
ncbi:MAG: ExbD/TolR family protein, partial [Burkholderiales bacterium]